MFWARGDRSGSSVQDDQSFTNPLLAFVIGKLIAEDSRRKALAVKAGMGRRRANGMHMGGPRKIGYDYVRDAYGRTVPDEPLRVVPAEAFIVAQIFRDYVAGNTQQSIQRALNAEGVRTVNGRTRHQGTIARILADPFYAGVLREGDNVVPGRHEAIVELALWQEAERIRRKDAGLSADAAADRPCATSCSPAATSAAVAAGTPWCRGRPSARAPTAARGASPTRHTGA